MLMVPNMSVVKLYSVCVLTRLKYGLFVDSTEQGPLGKIAVDLYRIENV